MSSSTVLNRILSIMFLALCCITSNLVFAQGNSASDASSIDADSKLAVGQETSVELLSGEFVEKPVWELGVGAAYFSGYDYPASKDPNARGLALPFYIFRSQVVRVGGGGLGAVAVEKPRVKLDFSVGGSLQAESSGNAARESMPDLDFLFELGPRLNFLVARYQHNDGGRSTVRWLNSARAVLSTDFSSLDGRGILLKSELQWQRKKLFGSNVDFRLQLDTQWASHDLQDYFYTVQQAFVTDSRPAYAAKAGYLGSEISTGFGFRFTPATRLFARVAFENYSGAANARSPLFETDNSVSFAMAFVWTIRSSQKSIMVFDED